MTVAFTVVKEQGNKAGVSSLLTQKRALRGAKPHRPFGPRPLHIRRPADMERIPLRLWALAPGLNPSVLWHNLKVPFRVFGVVRGE
jgi:hypothetical protein